MTDTSIAARPQRARRSAPEAVVPSPEPQAAPIAPAVNGNGHDAPTVRPVRKPFGSHVQKLAYAQREGYHRHWFKDSPGRIARALEAGYSHVKGEDGKNVSQHIGLAEMGRGLDGYLMEIPIEWYKEDQALKDAKRDDIDKKLRRGVVAGVAPGQDGAYLPMNKSGTIGPDVKMNGK